jgi:predicted AlkP superfamily phosphohydrolase/phosphomutase
MTEAAIMKQDKRTVIIGLDGVPWGLLKDLAEKGVMPRTRELISGGTFRKMRSSVPEVSSVAWSSVITGADPAEHGIFGFTEFPRGTYRLSFPNFNDLKVPPFWENGGDKKHVIINVPSTYPARSLRGVLISGFVALDLEKAVYPDSIIPRLKGMGYNVDVDSGKAHDSLELFLKDLNRTNEARISAYRHLWEDDWDVFMLVFTGSDRLMHFLWDAYEEEDHAFHEDFKSYFRRVDEIIGEVSSGIESGDDLIMLSDHGFEKLERDVYVNTVLKKRGLLRLKKGAPGYSGIEGGTRAFALDPARVYINHKGKYPEGCVREDEREAVIEELTAIFNDLRVGGRKVIRNIYRKEEIYDGPMMDRAPDLVLVGESGFNLKAAMNSDSIDAKGVFTGKHTPDDAFLLINKRRGEDVVPAYPSVGEVVKIMKRLNGGMDG